ATFTQRAGEVSHPVPAGAPARASTALAPRIPASRTANGMSARPSSAVTAGRTPCRARPTPRRRAITAVEARMPDGGTPTAALAATRAAHWVTTTAAPRTTWRAEGRVETTTRTVVMLTRRTGRVRRADQYPSSATS